MSIKKVLLYPQATTGITYPPKVPCTDENCSSYNNVNNDDNSVIQNSYDHSSTNIYNESNQQSLSNTSDDNGINNSNNEQKIGENLAEKYNNFINNPSGTTTENSNNMNNNINKENNDNKESNINKEIKNDNKKPSNKMKYIIPLIVIAVIIIILSVAIFVYRKKELNKPKDIVISNEIQPGNLMEKIKAIDIDSHNDSTLLNFNMANVMNTNLSGTTGNESIQINNALEPYNKDNEHYKVLNSLSRGLKPPPARDTDSKKKNFIKVKGSPLAISTKRKSNMTKRSDSYSINRSSTEISLPLTPTLMANGSVNGYKNNKLNKHTSVAMTFGCQSVSDREDGTNEISNISGSNRVSSQTNPSSCSRVSSQRSLTSFLTNSPITQSFKNRFSYYMGNNRRSRATYNNPKYSDSEKSSSYDEYTSRNNTVKGKNIISVSDFGDISNSKSSSNISNRKSNNTIEITIPNNINEQVKEKETASITSPNPLSGSSTSGLLSSGVDQDCYVSFLNDGNKSIDITTNEQEKK